MATPTAKAVLNLAWPLALKAMMLHGIIVIDAFLVSSLGEAALAAMGLAGAISGLVLGFLFAFSSATQILIAQAFGAEDARWLKTSFYCGLLINLTVTAIGLLAIWTLGDRVISAFAHDPWIAEQAQRYLAVFALVILSEAVSQCIACHFNGCGNTRVSFFSYLISLPVNIVFSVLLIHGYLGFPALGVMGAAAGSAVAALVRAVYLTVMLLRSNNAFADVAGWSSGTLAVSARRHLFFTLPIAATFVSMTISNQVCILIYARMEINQFAAMTLIMPWVQVVGSIGIAWAQATGIFMAQILGRGLPAKELDLFLGRAWRAMFLAAAMVSAVYTVVCLGSDRIYTGLQPETRAALLSFLVVLVFLPFPKGSNAICGNTLRAAGDTVYVMNLFVGAQWLFKVPMTAFFVLYLDLSAAWVFSIFLMEEIVKFLPFHLRIWRGRWKQNADLRTAPSA